MVTLLKFSLYSNAFKMKAKLSCTARRCQRILTYLVRSESFDGNESEDEQLTNFAMKKIDVDVHFNPV